MRNSDYKNHIIYSYLKDLPSDWRVLPNRAIFKERIERGFEDKNLLSVTIEKGIISQEELIESTSKKDSSNEDKSNYKLVKVNDIAYNKMRMWQGAVGYSQFEGIVSPAYVILRPIADINSRYYHYLFRTNLYKTYSYTYSYGISNDTLSLRWDEFKRMFSIIPPRMEQDAIVKFLEEKIADIDKYISAKQRLIDLLNEQKAAIINQAVTRGINSNVKMKDSGVEWLGEIPADWEIRKLKYIGKFISGFSFDSGLFVDAGVKVLKITNIQTMQIDWEDISFIPDKYLENYKNFIVKKGDIIFALTRPVIKSGLKAALFEEEEVVLLNQRNAIFRIGDQIRREFIYYVIFCDQFEKEFGLQIDFTNQQPNISTNDIGNIKIGIPPNDELLNIIKYLKSQIEDLNNSISNLRKEIEIMGYYKNTLIAEAVTGKLKIT